MNLPFYLLPKSEVAYLKLDDNIGQALRFLNRQGYQAVPVIDDDGHYIGTISEGDFLWNLIKDYHNDIESMRQLKVASMKMRWDYKPVSIEANIRELRDMMLNQNFVPVVDGRNVFIGIVTRKQIMTELLKEQYEKETADDD